MKHTLFAAIAFSLTSLAFASSTIECSAKLQNGDGQFEFRPGLPYEEVIGIQISKIDAATAELSVVGLKGQMISLGQGPFSVTGLSEDILLDLTSEYDTMVELRNVFHRVYKGEMKLMEDFMYSLDCLEK